MKKFIAIMGLMLSLYTHAGDADLADRVQDINPKLSFQQATEIVTVEQKYAKKYNIPVEVGLSVSAKESTFKVQARNGNSHGLKMVNYQVWHKEINVSKDCLKNIDCNTETGYKILKIYLDKSDGNMRSALMKYRGSGKKRVDERYADSIMHMAEQFKRLNS